MQTVYSFSDVPAQTGDEVLYSALGTLPASPLCIQYV